LRNLTCRGSPLGGIQLFPGGRGRAYLADSQLFRRHNLPSASRARQMRWVTTCLETSWCARSRRRRRWRRWCVQRAPSPWVAGRRASSRADSVGAAPRRTQVGLHAVGRRGGPVVHLERRRHHEDGVDSRRPSFVGMRASRHQEDRGLHCRGPSVRTQD